MNNLLRKIGAVVFSIGSAAVWAATPLAVWDGDFTSATQGDFSITATNGNTIAKTSITIAEGATGGVVFTGPNSSLNNSTFIIKGSNLNLKSENNQYLLSAHQNSLGGGNGDASYNKVGVSLKAQNEKVQGIWQNAMYENTGSQQVALPLTSGSVIVINIQVNNGVFVYEITDGQITKVYGHTALE